MPNPPSSPPNPYLPIARPTTPATEPVLATRSVSRTAILDLDGQTVVGVVEQVVLTDALGSQEFVETTGLVRSDDGVLIDPAHDHLYACDGCGRRALSARSAVVCANPKCRRTTCVSCLVEYDDGSGVIVQVCRSCGTVPLLRSVLRWLCQV